MSGAAGTLDSYTFFDGLGRAIQTKSESATAAKQIAVDTTYNSRGMAENVYVPVEVTETAAYTTPDLNRQKTVTDNQATNGISRLRRVRDDFTEETFAYDALGRTTSVTKTIDSKVFTTGYTYDALGRTVTTTYPDNEVVTYKYNRASSTRTTWARPAG